MDNGEFGKSRRPEEPRKPTPMRQPTPGKPARSRRRIGWGWILSGIVLAIIIIPSLLSDMITDWMWFASQNLAAVYTTRLWLSVGVFFASGLLTVLFCWVNWTIAWRGARPDTLYLGQREPLSRGVTRAIMLIAVLVVGLFMGLVAAGEWPTILLYVNSVPFGQSDPIFNNDVGFYVFGLPFYRFLQGWMLALLIVAAIGAGLIYFLTSGLSQLGQQFSEPQRGGSGVGAPSRMPLRFNLDKRIGTHLSILGAIFLLLLSVSYWLDRFDLLYSSRAVGYGAGYTDVNARLPAQYIMMVVAALAGVLLLANIWVRTWKLLLGALAAWLLALILVGGVYPTIIQSFVVKPSEQSLEKPYILNNIAATRKAFSLENFKEREVPAVTSISRTQIEENRDTVSDIRLWDYRPLLDTFGQLQEIRSYYNFDGVDIDRYQIDGKTRQVMISARELTTSQLNAQAKTWQNLHLVYTHGYGAVAASVNDIQGEGLPHLLLKNVPPETDIPTLKITRPEIYFGEQTDDYVFVNSNISNTQEFDYPVGDQTKYTSYQGKGGVALSNIFAKLLFAVRFGDGNVMLSSSITPETRVLFHRNIGDAVKLLAPFLLYDNDPYIAISEGKMYWIQDAYTTSDHYPYSTPYDDQSGSGFNYIRNSVKVVISAYDGSATFYVADPTDPIVKAYRGIFPALFKDIAEMPADLRSHVRYPEELMNIQAQMYSIFHMTDPQVFYNREDVWTVPLGTQSETSAALQAYYTIMSLPGEKNVSFRLILPFTPTGKNNMIAWMAADSDGANYGRVDVIRYPKQQLVYGPTQIEARIDQDPNISQQLTLWNQSGSKVLRGNLLVIPISNTVLYVEPLFLQAASSTSSIPELKRVIVATGDRVGIGSDLNGALDVALGAAPPPPMTGGGGGGTNPTPGPGQTPQPGTTPSLRTPAALTQSALQHYDRAQSALRQADWTTYGREIDAMKADLDQLAVLTGVPTVGPSPVVATPTP